MNCRLHSLFFVLFLASTSNVLASDRPIVSGDKTVREVVEEHLWKTPLGSDFNKFMTEDIDRGDLMVHVRKITQDVFSGGGKSVTRISVLQYLAEALFANEQLSVERLKRYIILQGNIAQMQGGYGTLVTSKIAYQAIAVFLFFLIMGWPTIRTNLYALMKNFFAKLAELSGLKFFKKRITPVEGPNFNKLFSRKAFSDYEFTKPFGLFFQYFGPYTMIFFFWYQWKESTKGLLLEEHIAQVEAGQKTLEELLRLLSNL